jgi:hypothetical protein
VAFGAARVKVGPSVAAFGREGLREQVLANVATMIAHRQNVPESAELIAGVAGTKPVWVTTQQPTTGSSAGVSADPAARPAATNTRSTHPA